VLLGRMVHSAPGVEECIGESPTVDLRSSTWYSRAPSIYLLRTFLHVLSK
jgi:hypothetical protein